MYRCVVARGYWREGIRLSHRSCPADVTDDQIRWLASRIVTVVAYLDT